MSLPLPGKSGEEWLWPRWAERPKEWPIRKAQGELARAAAAGTEYGLNMAKQNEEDVQKKMLNAAQMVKLNQDIVRGAWNNKNLPQEYLQKQIDWSLNYAKELADLGVQPIALDITDHKKLTQMGVANPQAVETHLAQNGDILFNVPNGKGGVNFYQVPGTLGKQRTTTDWEWSQYSVDPKDPTKHIETKHTTKAGQDRIGERLKSQMSLSVSNDKVLNETFKNKTDKDKGEREKVPTTQEGAIIQQYLKLYPNDPVKAYDLANKEIQKGKEKLRSITNINNAPASSDVLKTWGNLLSDPRSGVTLAQVKPADRNALVAAMEANGQKIAHPLTAKELERSDLSYNAVSNIEEAQKILERRPDMFGPAGFGKTQFQKFIKGGDPDALAYQTAITLANLPAAGIHGVRGKWAIEDLAKYDSDLYNNAESMRRVLGEIHRSASEFKGMGGRVLDEAAPAGNTDAAARAPDPAAGAPVTAGSQFEALPVPPNEPVQPGKHYGKGPKGTGWYR
jgi:hypothetical protein